MGQDYMDLLRVFRQFHKLGIRELLPGISEGQLATLQAVRCLGMDDKNVKVMQIAGRLGVARAGVSRSLRELEQMGLVERETDRDDRRNTLVSLTRSGAQVLDESIAVMRELADAVFSRMRPEDLKKLKGYLNQIYEMSREEIEIRKAAVKTEGRKREHE